MSSSVPPLSPQDQLKKAAANQALEFIQDNSVVGLGTGSTMRFLLEGLAIRVKEGLRIRRSSNFPSHRHAGHANGDPDFSR